MFNMFIRKSRIDLDALWSFNSLHPLLLIYVLKKEYKLRFVQKNSRTIIFDKCKDY